MSCRLRTALAAQDSPAVRGELLHVCQQDLAETPKLRERCQIALADPGPCADELLWLLEAGGGEWVVYDGASGEQQPCFVTYVS